MVHIIHKPSLLSAHRIIFTFSGSSAFGLGFRSLMLVSRLYGPKMLRVENLLSPVTGVFLMSKSPPSMSFSVKGSLSGSGFSITAWTYIRLPFLITSVAASHVHLSVHHAGRRTWRSRLPSMLAKEPFPVRTFSLKHLAS